jgi:hypothetical protein
MYFSKEKKLKPDNGGGFELTTRKFDAKVTSEG